MSTKTMSTINYFKNYLLTTAIFLVVLFAAVIVSLFYQSFPSIKEFGLSFYTSGEWDTQAHRFGALAFLVGTLLTSFLALLISIPFSLMISIFLGEYFKEGMLSNILKSMVDLLAGIPSIVYGLWGVFVFLPQIRKFYNWIDGTGLMEMPVFPHGIFSAAIVLAIMIIPFSASIGREVISLVPNDLKEAGYSMGGTRFEVIRKIILPYCRSGIFAGILLALGRALGETMAVTMLIGNRNFMPKSIFDPANTLASVIANQFGEASEPLLFSSLIHLGLVLLLTTTIINILGKYIIKIRN